MDEYQDINPAQYRLLKLLADGTRNVCGVGDSDQAIYAFRGADIGIFLDFEKDYPACSRITLSHNYRSRGAILKAADRLIRNNTRRIAKELAATREEGAQVSVISVPDGRVEGSFIIREIESRIGGTSHSRIREGAAGVDHEGCSFRFSDFGVIFRTNAQARELEAAFLDSGIPYQVIGRKSSMQAREIAETTAYLRSFLGEDAEAAGHASQDQESRLLGPADLFDPRADAVTLMTMHMAKGLEFKVVFIAGCEEGLVPCTIMNDDADIEEERRLFYVGMTRAQDELFLLSARKRFLYGQQTSPLQSPFLGEIPPQLLRRQEIPDTIKKQKEADRQMGLF